MFNAAAAADRDDKGAGVEEGWTDGQKGKGRRGEEKRGEEEKRREKRRGEERQISSTVLFVPALLLS